MPKVVFIKKARKDYPPDIKKSDSYYHWAFMHGGRGGPLIRSKQRPSRSQLTQSPFKSALYSLQDDAQEKIPTLEDIESERDFIVGELETLKDETESSLENMPESLQEGETGRLLQTRIDSLEEAISEIENVDCFFNEDDKDETQTDEEYKEQWEAEKWEEVTSALSNIDEG